jgi:hypothetical protein
MFAHFPSSLQVQATDFVNCLPTSVIKVPKYYTPEAYRGRVAARKYTRWGGEETFHSRQ